MFDLRLCDLNLRIEGSWLEERINELYAELDAKQLLFRPHFYLSDDWFCPDGVPGVAIPFYLAHPRLMRIENAQMLEVEGGTPQWCMQILRHEAGHAIDNAFDLRKRQGRAKVFGRSSTPYPEFYVAKPYSRRFVLHLRPAYAQSHPDEDFAETFAVWLTPFSEWEMRYAGWPALRKLRYMDHVMKELRDQRPTNRSRRQVDPLHRLTKTLREHYARKREHYGLNHPDFFERDLRRLFSTAPEHAGNMPAARFLQKVRREMRRHVSSWTGEYQYTIDQVLLDMIRRAKELHLRLRTSEEQTRLDFAVLLTVQTMEYLQSGRHRIAL